MSDRTRTPTRRSVALSFDVPDDLPATLPVLPLRRGVVLPGGVGPLALGRAASVAAVQAAGRFDPTAVDAQPTDGLLVIALQDRPIDEPGVGDLLPVGVLARVIDGGQAEGRAPFVVVQALARVSMGAPIQVEPFLAVAAHIDERPWPEGVRAEGTWRAARHALEQALTDLELTDVARILRAPLPRALWVDAAASLLDADATWKRAQLLTPDPVVRAERLMEQVEHLREIHEARAAVQERVKSENRDQQKEHVLRQQLRAIQEELGEGDGELDALKARVAALELPDDVRAGVDREVTRIDRLRDGSPERSVAVDWLTWVAELPWNTATGDPIDLATLEASLDRSHFGLEDVKRQVVEHLAVRKLSGSGRADVLLLVGPPGVGKTSVGQAIAEATGRELVRVALGGVRDESEIRGHRRTYVGARPGRIIEGVRRAATADPVILLDEVDKLGQGWQGDPGSALLELLDPEQNHAFTDRYLEVPFDLSRVLFIATANDLGKVPGPLRDRMEVLRIDGYTIGEKVRITRDHLLEKLARNSGLEVTDVRFSDAAIEAAITGYTREAGVRSLQRTLGRVYRAAAVRKAKGELDGPLSVGVDDLPTWLGRRRFHDEDNRRDADLPGVATGLAWTPVGGDVLSVEAAALPGSGQLVLTGQLGDVMKESARAALTYALSHADRIGIDAVAARQQDIHIHVPAGAVPKDGPSAGVTLFTALASLLSGRPVRADTAMTGEATLRGRVLPVGGVRSKVLAAHRQGLKRIILPRRNGVDLDDVPAEALAELDIVLVDHMDEVLAAALAPAVVTGAASDAASDAVSDAVAEPEAA